MKRILTLTILSLVLNTKAQYFETTYAHPTTNVSSGQPTNINTTGFLMGSYENVVTPGPFVYNFIIDKTDDNGDFTSSNDFSNGFQIWDDVNCSTSGILAQTADCKGISVIEVNPTPINGGIAFYALAGATNNGPFFAMLGQNGVPLVDERYERGSMSTITTISKPLIVECTTTPNTYFIVGHINGILYALKVKSNGGIIWSKYYRTAPALQPKDIIECPYTGDLTVVGLATFPAQFNRATDGFFLKIDANSSVVNVFKTYGHPINNCNEFFSIEVAQSGNLGSNGFVIGGWSDPVAANGNGWMLKIDPVGNIVWNTLIESSAGMVASPFMVGVFERLNTSSQYEYYGVGTTFSGCGVFKLDDNGVPFTGGNNEFWFDVVSAPLWSDASALSYVPAGGPSTNEGFQVYGVDQIGGGNPYLVSAYFNGVTGCETPSNILNYENGPNSIIQPSIKDFGGLNMCPNFQIRTYPLSTTPTYECPLSSSVAGGSNAKLSAYNNKPSEDVLIKAYPNPTHNEFNLEINNINSGEVLVYNNLGQLVYSQKVISGINTLHLNVTQGIYHYKIIENEKTLANGKIAIE